MRKASAVMMRTSRDGLYESFYFRATSSDGRYAFWLKHNLLRRYGESAVQLDLAFILFDRQNASSQVLHQQQTLSADALPGDWQQARLGHADSAYSQITPTQLQGSITENGQTVSWDWTCQAQGQTLYHFPAQLWYHTPWPKKKILTVQSRLVLQGSLRFGDLLLHGRWVGMTGHNWGREHAYRYAYANCTEFAADDAYFDGLSAHLALARRHIITPPLSLACLHLAGRWHRFDSLLRAPRQRVTRLDDEHWHVDLLNDEHRLRVRVDAAPPGVCAWVGLHYEHPDGSRSVVRNTKFAQLELNLYTHAGRLIRRLHSDRCELETLLPEHTAGTTYKAEIIAAHPSRR